MKRSGSILLPQTSAGSHRYENNAMSSIERNDRFALVFALLLPTIITLLYFVWLGKINPVLGVVAYGPLKVLQFGFPLVWVYLVQKRRSLPLEEIAFASKGRRFAGIGIGLAFGAIVMIAGLAAHFAWLKPSGFYEPHMSAIHAKAAEMKLTTPLRMAALGVFYSLVHSLLEEYYWRWFVFRQCRRHLALAPAILVSSLGFMSHHVVLLAEYFGWHSPTTYVFSLGVAIGGAVWAWLYERYSSLLGPWLSHLLIDAAIFAIGYNLLFG
jgi:membrane protease YdiL (CAAX protease family)